MPDMRTTTVRLAKETSQVPAPAFILKLLVALLMVALTSHALPAGPTLVHPQATVPEFVSLPYFDWDDLASLSEAFPGSYEIQIDNNSDFSSPLGSATVPALISYYSPHDELAPSLSPYYWQVRHLDTDGVPDTEWSKSSFTRSAPHVIPVSDDASDMWAEIKARIQDAITYTQDHPGEFAEIQFPDDSDEVITILQPTCSTASSPEECELDDEDGNSASCPGDADNDFLFRITGTDTNPVSGIIVNGQGRKLLIRATRRTCGFYQALWASRLQLKNLTIDYAPESLSQFGGKITDIDSTAHVITVKVDTDVYKNEAEFAPVNCGFFVDGQHHQRVGEQKLAYTMDQDWEDAKTGEATYTFGTSGWGLYSEELKVGDYFVSTARGGDLISLFKGVDDFVANDLTVNGSRGRYFAVLYTKATENKPEAFCRFSRSINNKFLRTAHRILGGPTGGVTDKGLQSWHENVDIQYTRDDAFHTGIPEGSENVLLRSTISGAFRNSAWIQADRSWVEGNTIRYAGTDGIALGGGGGPNYVAGTDTQVLVGLIRNNTILSPRQAGIVSRPLLDDDTTADHYNRYITLAGNTVRDHQSNEAVLLDSLAHSEVSGNKVESTGVALYPSGDWRIYSYPADEYGFRLINSQDITGSGNEVTDPRISCANRATSNFAASLSGPSSGLHESWNCATIQAFTSAGTLAGDHSWAINAPNFKVEVLSHSLLDSPGFGRVVSDVLPLKSATAVDKHTTALASALTSGTSSIRLQARFFFNGLTTSGRGEVRFGVENAASGQLYALGLDANSTTSPIQLYAASTSNAVAIGSPGDQTTSGLWEVDAVFKRVSATTTTVDYVVTRPNATSYTGTATFSTAVSASATFNQGFLTFKQRGQVVFDWLQATAGD